MSIKVLEIAKAGLEGLDLDSVRYFDWKKRRQIYKLLNVDSTDRCQPKLYYEFWKWWTEVALPKALDY